nr:hypothetical protein DBT41_14485 [Aerococcus urinae]
MRKTIIAGAAAALLTGLFAANSYADTAASAHPDRAKIHQSMCADRAARATGRLAYLEARLNLTEAQKAPFAKYRDAVTANAKAAEQDCLARPEKAKSWDKRPSIVDRQARMQQMLEMKLAELKATRPALETLYASLNADQKAVLDRSGGEGHRHFARWRGDDRHGGMEHKARFQQRDGDKSGPDSSGQQ